MSKLVVSSSWRLATKATKISATRSNANNKLHQFQRQSLRAFGMREVTPIEDPPPSHTLETVKPPEFWTEAPEDDPDPMAYVRKPVTSAQMIDVWSDPPRLSEADKVTITKTSTVEHGLYGELSKDLVAGIPLEYLALLRPSAEGAAAVRQLTASASDAKGTLLVFGASQPSGISALQLGVANGHSVVAVVGGEHSGNSDMCEIVKGLTKEPGFMVPEELAMVKKNFQDLVMDSSTGTSNEVSPETDQYLTDFKQNLMDYIATYPESIPAAVDKDEFVFKGKDKDRTYFRDNMEAYLSQFPKGAPSIPEQDLLEKFPKDQYAVWKSKFGKQTSAVLSGGGSSEFNPADIVKEMIAYPETVDEDESNNNYEFSILQPITTSDSAGGPILGAVIAVTPFLKNACEALDEAKTLKEKAEALQFLPVAERNAYAAASSVVALAKNNGADIIVVGGNLKFFFIFFGLF